MDASDCDAIRYGVLQGSLLGAGIRYAQYIRINISIGPISKTDCNLHLVAVCVSVGGEDYKQINNVAGVVAFTRC